MKIRPNKSVLSIITKSDDEKEHVLFMYLKPVADMATNDLIFWYKYKGSSGEAVIIWREENIKQWVATGNDKVMVELFNKITNGSTIIIEKSEVNFSFPETCRADKDADSFMGEEKSEIFSVKDIAYLPIKFRQKDNLDILSGYQKSEADIKVLYPYGFFNKGFIQNNIEKGIIAINESRVDLLKFHAVRKNIKEGPRQIVGFLQSTFDPQKKYTAILNTINGEFLSASEIDKKNGSFLLVSEQPTQSGEIKIKIDEEVTNEVPYHFIMNVDFNISMVNEVFTDAYKRNNHKETPKTRPEIFNPFTWHTDLLAGNDTNFIKLSDLIRQTLLYLGPDVLIADPYFLGDYTISAGITSVKKFQMPLLNAVCHSFFDTALSKLSIMGYNGRANDHVQKNESMEGTKTEQRFKIYETVLSKMLSKNILEIDFFSSNSEFHNRYWFGCKKMDDKILFEKVIVLTNSFGDLKEIDFIEITDKAQKEIIFSKYSHLLNNATKSLTIKS